LNTASGVSIDQATKPKTVYHRVSREQRGCSQTGAEYNGPFVMVDEIFLNTKGLFSPLT
jgi:hypothetical protein